MKPADKFQAYSFVSMLVLLTFTGVIFGYISAWLPGAHYFFAASVGVALVSLTCFLINLRRWRKAP